MPEDVVARARIGGDEIAHVFDEAEQRHIGPPQHIDCLLGVDQRQILRGRDDHRAGQRHLLNEADLDIAGARRQIDHEDIEFAPVAFAQQLSKC